MSECRAVLNVKGEHFPCEVDAPHPGWGHANKGAQAIWAGEHDVDAFPHPAPVDESRVD